MATAQQQADFLGLMSGYAEQASAATGLDARLILAQWGNETNYGTHWAEQNNVGNVGVYAGGPNPSYPTLAAGVQAYINFINGNSRYEAVRQATTPEAQAQALGASGYAGGGYNDGGGPGSSLITVMSGWGVNLNGAKQADFAGTAVTGTGTGANVATAQTGGQAASASSAGAAPPAPAAQTDSTTIAGKTYTGTAANVSAIDQIDATFQAYGMSPADAASLANSAWGELINNTDPSQIPIDIQTPGSPFYPIFEKYFPGFVGANQQLASQGLPAMSVSKYSDYQTTVMAQARAAGLPNGFINKNDIGILVGNNVSASEVSARLNDAVAMAYNFTPQQVNAFSNYFGVDTTSPFAGTGAANPGQTYGGGNGNKGLTAGQMAALALDPTKAEPLIHQEIAAAAAGGASVTAGLGGLSKAEAMKLAQAGVVTVDTTTGKNNATGLFAPLGQLAPLEQTLPGRTTNAAAAVLTPDQIANANLLGAGPDVRAQQVAQESRGAPYKGGGGFTSSKQGAGVGSANSGGAAGT